MYFEDAEVRHYVVRLRRKRRSRIELDDRAPLRPNVERVIPMLLREPRCENSAQPLVTRSEVRDAKPG
jgi:hypothetical protein